MSAKQSNRIYFFGASGAGTTTLGTRIAKALSLTHVDCDDHYWAPVEPPFSLKRTPEERVVSMKEALGKGGWILTGACNGWGAELIEKASLLVFLTVSTPVRLERLAQRQKEQFGQRIEAGGDMYEIHHDFLTWASEYENPNFEGRNLARHEVWLKEQTMPVRRVDGSQQIDASVDQIMEHLALS